MCFPQKNWIWKSFDFPPVSMWQNDAHLFRKCLKFVSIVFSAQESNTLSKVEPVKLLCSLFKVAIDSYVKFLPFQVSSFDFSNEKFGKR